MRPRERTVRCDEAQVAASMQADGELTDGAARQALADHLVTCAECRQFGRDVERLRSHLRVEAVGHAPDLGPSVVARLRAAAVEAPATSAGTTADDRTVPRVVTRARGAGRADRRVAWAGRRPAAVAAAIALVAGVAAGATFVGLGTRPRSPAAADVPDLVMGAQQDVVALDARLRITETGIAGPAGGAAIRSFDAHLAYRAPESLALRVREVTPGRAAAEGVEGDLVVDGDRWWQRSSRRCSPTAGLVLCPDAPVTWVRAVTGREPFSPATPVPLDLVTPVDSFALAATPAGLGTSTVAGHPAVGVVVPAAQVAPLLDGLRAAIDLRPIHPTDPVELWLDRERGVPLALAVRAAGGPERQRWATSVGATESAGDVILTATATSAEVNGTVTPDAFDPPGGAPAPSPVDAGFRADRDGTVGEGTVEAPRPAHLPAGFRPYRSGTVVTQGGPSVGVRTWSDGRAWVSVRATTGWPGGRLFGDLGPDVRPVDLGPAGVGYATSDGRRIGLHTARADIVVGGSLPAGRIEDVAADLGVVGRTVPDDWDEAATATLDEAAATLPGLLVAPRTEGFGPAAVRIDEGTVTQAHAGAGRRHVTLTQRASEALAPPSAGDEFGVRVRGTDGRYSQQGGELEWTEDGLAVSLRSDTLALDELVALARSLVPADGEGSA